MARANSAVEEGTFYYEVEILKGGGESIFTETVMASPVSPQTSPRADFKEMPHVRVGFANRTADLQVSATHICEQRERECSNAPFVSALKR